MEGLSTIFGLRSLKQWLNLLDTVDKAEALSGSGKVSVMLTAALLTCSVLQSVSFTSHQFSWYQPIVIHMYFSTGIRHPPLPTNKILLTAIAVSTVLLSLLLLLLLLLLFILFLFILLLLLLLLLLFLLPLLFVIIISTLYTSHLPTERSCLVVSVGGFDSHTWLPLFSFHL